VTAKGWPRRTTSCRQPSFAVRCSRPLRSHCRSQLSSTRSATAAACSALPGRSRAPHVPSPRSGWTSLLPHPEPWVLGPWCRGSAASSAQAAPSSPGVPGTALGTAAVPGFGHPPRRAPHAGLSARCEGPGQGSGSQPAAELAAKHCPPARARCRVSRYHDGGGARQPALERSPGLISALWAAWGRRPGSAAVCPHPTRALLSPGNARDGSVPRAGRGQLSRQLHRPVTADEAGRRTVNPVTKRVSGSPASGARLCLPPSRRRQGCVPQRPSAPSPPPQALRWGDAARHRSRPAPPECSAGGRAGCQNKQKCFAQESTR